jgi:uncharacterized protein YndB with AHSA1/START domain
LDLAEQHARACLPGDAEPAAGGTELEFLHEQFFDEAARDGHERGWGESFAKLERFLQETH